MSNRKLYMLKVACARLHDLKVQERRYKGALVKRACMHLLIKQAADPYKDFELYEDLDADQQRALDAKVDWNSGFWGTALGKFLRPYFENGEHEDAYAQVLTKAKTDAEMVDILSRLGVDPRKHRDLMQRAKDLKRGKKSWIDSEKAKSDARDRSEWEARYNQGKEAYEAEHKYGIEHGWIKDDKKEGGNPYSYYGFGGPFRRSGYLTDLQAKYDPDFAREYGLGGGTVINNYYYGPDGKRHEVPPAAGTSPDPSKPGATTPGSDPNPDLPGLSTMLGTSGPGAQYVSGLSSLSGMTLDPKRLSIATPGDPLSTPGLPSGLGTYSSDPVVSGGSFGSTALTTTGDPAIDLGKGSISVDPSMSPVISASTPDPPATLSAIDKAGTIGHDLADVFGGGSYVDRGTDWLKATYGSLPDYGKEIVDTAVSNIGSITGPSAPDPSKPWTTVPKI